MKKQPVTGELSDESKTSDLDKAAVIFQLRVMTTDNYIEQNKTTTFKKGDKVVMHTCHESTFEKYKDKVWICQTDSFLARDQSEVVFLEGFSGYFAAHFLKIKKSAHQIWQEAKDRNLNDEDFKKYLKAEGVIVSKESLDRQREIAENIQKRILNTRKCVQCGNKTSGENISYCDICLLED